MRDLYISTAISANVSVKAVKLWPKIDYRCYRNKISNIIDNNTKKKEWGKTNSYIKIYILWSLIFFNLSLMNFIK